MPSSPTGGGGITPLCSAGGAVPRPSSVPGGSLPCGMLFSTVSCVSPLEAARPVSGTKQKPKKISAAPMGQLTARARTILVQSYLQYRFCWGFLLRWIECGESTPGVRRSELQRCPLGHIYDHRMDLTQIRSRWRNPRLQRYGAFKVQCTSEIYRGGRGKGGGNEEKRQQHVFHGEPQSAAPPSSGITLVGKPSFQRTQSKVTFSILEICRDVCGLPTAPESLHHPP